MSDNPAADTRALISQKMLGRAMTDLERPDIARLRKLAAAFFVREDFDNHQLVMSAVDALASAERERDQAVANAYERPDTVQRIGPVPFLQRLLTKYSPPNTRLCNCGRAYQKLNGNGRCAGVCDDLVTISEAGCQANQFTCMNYLAARVIAEQEGK